MFHCPFDRNFCVLGGRVESGAEEVGGMLSGRRGLMDFFSVFLFLFFLMRNGKKASR